MKRLFALLALFAALALLFCACAPAAIPDSPTQPTDKEEEPTTPPAEDPAEELPGDQELEPDMKPDPEPDPVPDPLPEDEGDGVLRNLTAAARAGLDQVYREKLAATQAFAEVKTQGTVYYISSIHGDDKYPGRTPARPWKSLAKCASTVQPGDTILFECGSVFRRESNDYFIRGLANNVTLASYGEGAKPIFYGSINVPASQWKAVSGKSNLYYFDGKSLNLNIYSDVGSIVFNEGEAWGIKIQMTYNDPEKKQSPADLTLALRGVSNGIGTYDIPSYALASGEDLSGPDLSFYHDYGKKRIYLYCEGGNPGVRFSSVELSLNLFAFSMQNPATDMTFLNLEFRNFGSHVIRTLNCNNLTVKNCAFYFVGGTIQPQYGTWRNYYTRLGNAVENWNACNGMTVENCFFDQIYDTAMTTQSNDNVTSKNIVYRNNVAQNMWFGVELWTTSNVEFSHVDVSGNYFAKIGEGFTSQRPDKVDPNTTFSVNAFIKVSGGPYQTKNDFFVTDNIADGTNGKMLFCNYPHSKRFPEGIVFDRNTYIAPAGVDFARFFGKYDGKTYSYTAAGIADAQEMGIERNGTFYLAK